MKRKKTAQRSQYGGNKTLHPIFSNQSNKRKLPEASDERVKKKARTEELSNTNCEQYFQLSMEKKLGEMIGAVANKNSKTEEKLLNDLKIKQCAVTKLPQSIISDDALIGNCETKMMRSYMEARIGKRNHLEWIDYMEKNSDVSQVSKIQKRKNIVETSKSK
ncbi:hypothetical protein EDC94DRAFT_104232 [Helicostylum pulchrum]|nr:hypothetical protein EDC94DRAFT_104232 [Helicostylum pulchrum]